MKCPSTRSYGAAIKQYRVNRGRTARDVAEVCDMHHSYLHLLERGTRHLSTPTRYKLAAALGVTAQMIDTLAEKIEASRRTT